MKIQIQLISSTHNRLHVLEGDGLLQHHLVERPNEESFEEHKDVKSHEKSPESSAADAFKTGECFISCI